MTGALVQTLDPADLLAAFCAGREDVGGVVSFTGYVRRDGDVQALELEAYPALAENEIARVARRGGRAPRPAGPPCAPLAPGAWCRASPSSSWPAAAAHRRAAFEGADQMMDWLKSRAPFWKKAHHAGRRPLDRAPRPGP